MTELDMTADVETEDFTDELSDEALDRQQGESKFCSQQGCMGVGAAGN